MLGAPELCVCFGVSCCCRSLAACRKGLLNSKNYVTMGLDVVPGAEEQPAMRGVRVLWHWVEAQGVSGGSSRLTR